jgi:hypothetical protein
MTESLSLSAVEKKVFFTTNERKVMSNKTFFKRIAVTAIAALGFGMLSVAPSNATVTAHTLAIDSATDSIALGETATAVLTHSFVNLSRVDDTVTIQGIVTSSNSASAGTVTLRVTDSYTSLGNDATSAKSPFYGTQAYVTSAGVGAPATDADSSTSIYAPSNRNNATGRDKIAISATGAVGASKSLGTQLSVDLYAPTSAGTYTITFYTIVQSDGGTATTTGTPTVTWTVTVTAPSKTATADSTVTVRQGAATTGGTYYNGTADGTDSQTLSAATATSTDVTPEFSLVVNQKNGTSTNTAQESFTVSVTGEAWITTNSAITARMVATDANAVKTMTFAYPAAGTPVVVSVWSTGTPGTATLTTTTYSGLVIGTDTLTFHGDVTTLAIGTVYKSVLQAGTASAIADVVTITAKDAGARAVTGLSVGIVSSDATQISTGSCTDNLGLAGAGTHVTDGTYLCSVTPVVSSASGKAVTLTIRTADPASTTGAYLTTTHAVTMGGAVNTVVLTLDKATYEPGEVMTITATAKDSSGNTPYDGISGPTLTSNKQLGASISMSTYRGGNSISNTRSSAGVVSNTTNLFAPAAAGKFTINGRDGQTTSAEISVSATVADDAATSAANAASDAAAEAIDAANAATDAANLAAEAADAATVAAEEARDAADAATAAVEALATEVATLMAALKAQITTLANTVAKIAKKVKA